MLGRLFVLVPEFAQGWLERGIVLAERADADEAIAS
jgi:hypothetical protein